MGMPEDVANTLLLLRDNRDGDEMFSLKFFHPKKKRVKSLVCPICGYTRFTTPLYKSQLDIHMRTYGK